MATAHDVIAEADRWVGTAEVGGKDNVDGITDRPGFYDAAWCCMFVSTVLEACGFELPGSGFTWVSSFFQWARSQPGWLVFSDPAQAEPGDIVGWEWGQTAGGLDHISFKVDQPFVTIGGNERNAVRKQSFGPAPWGAVIFARPPYETPVPALPDLPKVDPMLQYHITNDENTGQLWMFWMEDDGKPIDACYLRHEGDVQTALTIYKASVGAYVNQGTLIDFLINKNDRRRPTDRTAIDVEALAAALAVHLGPELAKQNADELVARLAD